MTEQPLIYATQGGGYAQIIGAHAYFVETLDVPGAYRFEIGSIVPHEWDLIPYPNYYKDRAKNSFEQGWSDNNYPQGRE